MSNVEYKELGFLNFPNYQVDNLGNVWSKRRTMTISFEMANQIRDEYKSGNIHGKELAQKYNISLYSVYRIIKNDIDRGWKKLKPSITKNGYLYVSLCDLESKKYRIFIHRIILIAFKGQPKSNQQCRHLDGNKKNNNLNNLEWGTAKENGRDKVIHKTSFHPNGEKCNFHKLKEADIIKIRELFATGEYTQTKLGIIFKTDASNIHSIVCYKTWRHI